MSSATAGSRPAGQRNVTVRDVKKGSKPRGDALAATANATTADRVSDKKSTSGHSKASSNSKPHHHQQRAPVASLLNDRVDSDDIESKVNEVYELTKASRDSIIVALHDSDGDLNRAVSKILEGDYDDEWTDVSKRGKKKDKKEKQVTPAAPASKSTDKGTNGTSRPNQANRTRPPRPKQAGEPKQPRQNHKKDSDPTIANHNEEKQVDSADRPAKKGPREVKKTPRPAGEVAPNPVRGRGTRTFSNQLREAAAPKPDEFPESIDVWQNTTADANSTRPAAPVVPMTVGNWSDVVRDDDWSEEDGFDGVKQTMVFVRSGKTPPEKDDAKATSHGLASKQCDPKQSEMSQQQNRTAGTQILQSLKPRPAGHDQNYSNKLAAESIKSLVGIPSAAYSSSAGNTNASAPTSATASGESQSSKPQRLNTARRSTKIPETAVEMPNSLVPLGIQFGALDVNFGTSEQSSGYSNDIKASANSTASTQVISNKVVPSNSVLVSSAYDQKGTLNTGELRSTEEMLKGSAYGTKVPEDSRSPMNKVKAVMDAVKGNDLYSSSITNQVANDPGFSKAAAAAVAAASYAAYGAGQNYSAGPPPVTTYQGSNYSAQSGAVFNVNSNYPTSAYPAPGNAAGAPNNTQKNLPGLKELDASSVSVGQLKHNSNYGDLHATANSTTQTTNVLKNSLSATGNGKNMSQPGVPRMLTQMLHPAPQYIVPGGMGPAFAYPLFDPNTMGMPPGQDASTFAAAYNSNASEHKFSRTEGNDSNVNTPSATSQAPVVSQHQQQYINAFPPGYGFYYTLPPQASLFPPQGAPFVHQVQTANNAPHASASAPGFAKTASYPGHSYSSSAYDTGMTGVPTDAYSKQPYGQTGNQHQSKNLVSGNADLMASQSSYGKGHGQVSKVS